MLVQSKHCNSLRNEKSWMKFISFPWKVTRCLLSIPTGYPWRKPREKTRTVSWRNSGHENLRIILFHDVTLYTKDRRWGKVGRDRRLFGKLGQPLAVCRKQRAIRVEGCRSNPYYPANYESHYHRKDAFRRCSIITVQMFASDMFPVTQLAGVAIVRDRDSKSSPQGLFAIQSYDKKRHTQRLSLRLIHTYIPVCHFVCDCRTKGLLVPFLPLIFFILKII